MGKLSRTGVSSAGTLPSARAEIPYNKPTMLLLTDLKSCSEVALEVTVPQGRAPAFVSALVVPLDRDLSATHDEHGVQVVQLPTLDALIEARAQVICNTQPLWLFCSHDEMAAWRGFAAAKGGRASCRGKQ